MSIKKKVLTYKILEYFLTIIAIYYLNDIFNGIVFDCQRKIHIAIAILIFLIFEKIYSRLFPFIR